jgi:molybdopterin converting factor small subunit
MYVEFLGIPRERIGVAELELEAASLGHMLTALASRYPEFGELLEDGRLHPSIAASLNAERFISDPQTPLTAGDRVLILSSDAGG